MRNVLLMALFTAGLLLLPSPRAAEAQGWGGFAPGAFYGPYFGFPAVWQNSYNGRVPPYFALHPPVYYSGQVVRIPYGASPFANVPAYPEAEAPCPASAPAAPAVAAANRAGEAITNPFYQAKPAKGTGTGPVEKGAANPASSLANSNVEQTGVMILNPHYRPATRMAQR